MNDSWAKFREGSLALKSLVEILGGRQEPSAGMSWLRSTSLFWGLWWGVLLILVLIFCGHSSKFIYIDF